MKKHWIWYTLKAALFISIGFFLFGWLIMTLWNALIPSLLHGPGITFSQALGIFILTRLLFWGLWSALASHRGGQGYWRRRLEKRLTAMTPEERDKFRQAYARRCGNWCKEAEVRKEVEAPKENAEPARQETVSQ